MNNIISLSVSILLVVSGISNAEITVAEITVLEHIDSMDKYESIKKELSKMEEDPKVYKQEKEDLSDMLVSYFQSFGQLAMAANNKNSIKLVESILQTYPVQGVWVIRKER